MRSRLRPPELAESRGASTEARKSAVGSGICWWTLRRSRGRSQGAQRDGPRPGRHQSAARTGSLASGSAFVPVGGDAGYRGRGKDWVEQTLGVEVEVVNRSPKPPPEKVLEVWAREWFKEGHEMDLGKLPTRPGFENLPPLGSQSEHSHGLPTTGAWRKTTRGCAQRAKPSSMRL
jgi:hypothetical protein